ncbi:MAG TPA: hypothetical protein VHO70_02395 [Chitinispirillaceae bacterium]|nr:hypothetical protein [Chitinispirillaceae bacterium]
MQKYFLQFVNALTLTVTTESAVLILFFLLRKHFRQFELKLPRVLIAGIVASCITLPAVWFIFPAVLHNRTCFLIVAELFAFTAEIPVIKCIVKSTFSEATVASLLANSTSFAAGFLLRISWTI